MDWKYGKVSSQCLDSEMEWHFAGALCQGSAMVQGVVWL